MIEIGTRKTQMTNFFVTRTSWIWWSFFLCISLFGLFIGYEWLTEGKLDPEIYDIELGLYITVFLSPILLPFSLIMMSKKIIIHDDGIDTLFGYVKANGEYKGFFIKRNKWDELKLRTHFSVHSIANVSLLFETTDQRVIRINNQTTKRYRKTLKFLLKVLPENFKTKDITGFITEQLKPFRLT